jgi:hypothetical protein
MRIVLHESLLGVWYATSPLASKPLRRRYGSGAHNIVLRVRYTTIATVLPRGAEEGRCGKRVGPVDSLARDGWRSA